MFARTPRLLLRPGWMEDAPALAAAIGDAAIVRHLASAPWPYDVRDAEAFLAASPTARSPRFLMFQRTAGAPRLVGVIGIDRTDDSEADLGYWIARPYWGLGYATEAGRHMVALARTLGLPPLTAGHFIDNPASGAVLRKLGFRATGRTVPRHSVGRGETVPCIMYVEDREGGTGTEDERCTPDRDEWRQMAA